jgi:hypothetical protein
MRMVIAFLGGAFPILLGYLYGPSPKHDPGHWGPCGLDSVFPVREPFVLAEGSYCFDCFDCYECVYESSLVGFSMLVLGGLFAISGYFVVKIARTHSIAGATIPAGVTAASFLVWMADGCDFLVLPTLVMGSLVWLSSLVLSAAGAWLATRDP